MSEVKLYEPEWRFPEVQMEEIARGRWVDIEDHEIALKLRDSEHDAELEAFRSALKVHSHFIAALMDRLGIGLGAAEEVPLMEILAKVEALREETRWRSVKAGEEPKNGQRCLFMPREGFRPSKDVQIAWEPCGGVPPVLAGVYEKKSDPGRSWMHSLEVEAYFNPHGGGFDLWCPMPAPPKEGW